MDTAGPIATDIDQISMPESSIKAARHAPRNATVKISYTFLTLLFASETYSPVLKMNDAICLIA